MTQLQRRDDYERDLKRRKIRISHDRTTRVITIKLDNPDGDLLIEEAKQIAARRLVDEGTDKDWYFEDAHRFSYDEVSVTYSA